MFLIAGLGNIGKEYENTRHNFGFIVADKIIKNYNFQNPSKKFASEVYSGKINKDDAIIIKPQTYMNNSGIAVSQVKNFYKIPLDKIIVFHDDLDLEFGRIKVKVGGGNGGHNGLKSIDNSIGKNYLRVRFGIGRPENKDDTHNYVLGKFGRKEKIIVKDMAEKFSDLIGELLKDKVKFLNKWHNAID
jgi:peptidyl-tRNA hydrolase, PTH1 family